MCPALCTLTLEINKDHLQITMPTFGDSLALSSAFKIPLTKACSEILVANNEQLLFTSGNSLIAIDLTSPAHNFKTLELGNSSVDSIQLNHAQDLLALICRTTIIIVSLKRIPFQNPQQSWKPLKFELDFPDGIVSVAWHPAHYSSAEIVVLTKYRLQLYDIISSTTRAAFDEKLLDLALHEEPTSIAFGSIFNLAGSMTLYYSTPSGRIYLLFPFIHRSFHLGASKVAIDLFVAETLELVSAVDKNFPPRVTAGHPSNNDLLGQLNFGLDLQQQLESPLLDSSDASRVFRLSPIFIKPVVSGPYAQVAQNSHIVLLDTRSDTSVLLTYHDSDSQLELAYLAQMNPLLMTSPCDIPRPDTPQHPGAENGTKKTNGYVKPKKGFGFSLAPTNEPEAATTPAHQLYDYSKAWEIYELKVKCQDFILLHQRLTLLSREVYKKRSPGPARVQPQVFGKVMLGTNNKFQVIDCLLWFGELQDNFPRGVTNFYSSKRTFSVDSPLTTVGLIQDPEALDDLYLLTKSTEGKVVVTEVYPKDKPKPVENEAQIQTLQPKTVNDVGISAIELKQMLRYPKTPLSFTSQTRNAEDLVKLSKISDDIRSHVHQLSKFLIALVGKLEVQQKRNLMHASLLHKDETLDAFKERVPLYEEQIKELLLHQKAILERANKLEKSTIERFEKIKSSTGLPISEAEKSWMRELNELTQTVTKDSDNKSSLEKRVQALQGLLETFKESHKESHKGSQSSEDISDSLKSLLLSNKLYNVAHHMKMQGETIKFTRERLQADVESADALVRV